MAIPGLELTERPWAGSTDARMFAQNPGPGNPNVPPGGSSEARSLRGVAPEPVAPRATAPGRLRSAFDAVTGRNFVGPSKPVGTLTRIGNAAGVAAGVASEAPDVLAVARDPNSSGVDAATQVAGAGGKLAAAGLGAKAGAALGAFGGPAAPLTVPLGIALGGAAGYFGADKLIEGGRSLFGSDTRDPAEQVAQRAAPPAATTLRTRPEDTFAGPPAAAAGAASPATDPGAPRRVDRPGQSPLFTNVADDAPYIGNNALMARGNGPNAQNMAAANNLAATDSLRSQGAALSGQLAGGSGIPAMPQTLHSGNDWASRKSLENLRTSAGSIYDSQSQWGNKAKAAADVGAFQNAQAMDTAARTGSDPGSVSRNSAQASMFGSKTAADASKENSRNSLRGTMYTADSQLGAKQMEMQQRLRQQQAMGELWKASGGDPAKFQSLAMQYGLPDAAKQGGDMAQSEQARAQGAATSASKRLEGMAVRDDGKGGSVVDQGRLAMLNSTLTKMAPGWQHMNEAEQAALYGKAESSVNLLEGLNDRRNNSFWQSIGVDGKSPELRNLPDMSGGRLKAVGPIDGATTGGGVARNDYVVEVGKHKLYLPRDKVNQGELELLKARGVDISGLQK